MFSVAARVEGCSFTPQPWGWLDWAVHYCSVPGRYLRGKDINQGSLQPTLSGCERPAAFQARCFRTGWMNSTFPRSRNRTPLAFVSRLFARLLAELRPPSRNSKSLRICPFCGLITHKQQLAGERMVYEWEAQISPTAELFELRGRDEKQSRSSHSESSLFRTDRH